MGADGERSRSVAEQLGDDLRDAFAAVGSASVTPDQRAKFQRRLLAITTAAKRDVVRAHSQLERFADDLRAAESSTDSAQDE